MTRDTPDRPDPVSLIDLLPPPGEPLVGMDLTATLAAGETVRGVDFVECRFDGGSFAQARLVGCRFEDCELDGVRGLQDARPAMGVACDGGRVRSAAV